MCLAAGWVDHSARMGGGLGGGVCALVNDCSGQSVQMAMQSGIPVPLNQRWQRKWIIRILRNRGAHVKGDPMARKDSLVRVSGITSVVTFKDFSLFIWLGVDSVASSFCFLCLLLLIIWTSSTTSL